MPDFNIRSDSVNVEQIMEQIRARIREKRGVDYTEQQIRELATVKLEKFLDPRGVRSDLLEQFRQARPGYAPPELPNYAFEAQTLYESHRAPLRWIRRLLRPLLKLLFNPNPLIQALNIQARLNTMSAEREARRDAARHVFDQLHYEVQHNLVVEMTRMSIEVKNLKMRVESLASRLEFNERRARALESVVVYKPPTEDRNEAPAPSGAAAAGSGGRSSGVREPPPLAQTAPASAPTALPQGAAEGPGQRSRRRRRRRGRRGTGSVAAVLGPGQPGAPPVQGSRASTADAEEAHEAHSTEPLAATGPSPSSGTGSEGPAGGVGGADPSTRSGQDDEP